MGTDHQRRPPRGDGGQDAGPLPPLVTPGQPGGRHPEWLQPVGQTPPVLLGQEFGGRHQGRLTAGLDRLQRRQGRHHRLARSDVALQQALHRQWPRQVGSDLGRRLLLVRCQDKGQRLTQALGEYPVLIQGRGTPPGMGEPQTSQAHLMGDQFLEGETPEGRVTALRQVGQADLQRWAVEIDQGRAQVREVQTIEDGRRQILGGGEPLQVVQCLIGQAPPGRLLQPRGRRIERRQPW